MKANLLFFDNREASPKPWTRKVWYYDYRTNVHHTLKKKPLRFEDLKDFIACCKPESRHKRKATWHPEKSLEGRWRAFDYEELVARDKASLVAPSRTARLPLPLIRLLNGFMRGSTAVPVSH